MKTTRRQFLKAAGTVTVASMLGSFNCEKPKKPNVLLIFSDELAYEYISCYGGNIQTPNIDKLAQQGLKFTHGYAAAPMCTPSRYSILTGQYAGRCKHASFLENYPTDQPYSIAWNTYLTDSQQTLPRLLSKNGYVTGMSGKWHVGQLPESVQLPDIDPDADPKDEQVNEKLQKRHELLAEQVKKQAGFDVANSVSWGNLDGFPVKALRHHNFPWMTKGAVDFIKVQAEQNRPFFLYAATTAVHGPYHLDQFKNDLRYTPQGKLDDVLQYQLSEERLNSLLADTPEWMHHKVAGMACLDNHVGILMQTLKDLGIEDNTIVIFMADHNIEPGKATCYEKGTRVPFVIRWPEEIQPGRVSDALVQSVDILPTLMQLAAAPLPREGTLDGKSMVPVLSEQSDSIREYIYTESGYARAVTDGHFKYIAVRYPDVVVQQMENGTMQYAPNQLNTFKQAHSQIAIQHFPHYFDQDQLYDLKNDPYEQNNLANNPDYAEELQRLKNALQEKLNTFSHPFNLDPIPFMKTKEYEHMAQNTRDIGTDFIAWLPRDHGKIVWPPKEDNPTFIDY